MSFNLRKFPTELVWAIRKKSAEQQMTIKEYVIQTLSKDTGFTSPLAVDKTVKIGQQVAQKRKVALQNLAKED
jgi:hypothetical protein